MQHSILFIGYGNMGSAFASGIKKKYPEYQILVMDPSNEACQRAKDSLQAEIIPVEKPDKIAEYKPSAIFLSVKPQHFPEAATRIAAYIGDSLLISLMAGITISTLQDKLRSIKVIRCMPNLAAAYGMSVTSVSADPVTDAQDVAFACSLAESAGMAIEIPEDLIASIIGISGSGIAFAFQFIHAMALAGTESGIAYPRSLDIVLQTVQGAAESIRQSGTQPAEYITKVCSPGGTTISGIAALEKSGFTNSVMQAVRSAADKSRHMEKNRI
ncbi:pyrroline-5-carboxylate reductase [Spirochaeta dissipatitropha]